MSTSDTDPGTKAPSQHEIPKSEHSPESALDDKDANVVDWDGPQDVAFPQNWTDRRKWAHIVMVSLFALVT